jgi:hypothetical protein
VQQGVVFVDHQYQSKHPQGSRAPLAAARLVFGTAIGQPLTHVVQQQIGVRVEDATGQQGKNGGFTALQ